MESIQSDLQHLNKFIMGFESLKGKPDYDKNPLEKHERYAVGVMKADGIKFDIHSGNENFIVNGAKKVWEVIKTIITKMRLKIKKMTDFFTKTPEEKKSLLNGIKESREGISSSKSFDVFIESLESDIAESPKEEIRKKFEKNYNRTKISFESLDEVVQKYFSELENEYPQYERFYGVTKKKYNELVVLSKVNESFPPTSEQQKNKAREFTKLVKSFLSFISVELDKLELEIRKDVENDSKVFHRILTPISAIIVQLSSLSYI